MAKMVEGIIRLKEIIRKPYIFLAERSQINMLFPPTFTVAINVMILGRVSKYVVL